MKRLPEPDRDGDRHEDPVSDTSEEIKFLPEEDDGVPSTVPGPLRRHGALHAHPISIALPSQQDDADGPDLGRYGRILRRRWRVILGAFVVVLLATALGTARATPIYRATGTIEIRKQAAEVVPVDVLFQVERISDQYLQTQYGVLRSPALARRAVTDSAFVSELRARGFLPDTAPGGAPAALESLANWVAAELSVNPVVGSRLVKVSLEAPDRWLAVAIVNSVFKHFVASRQEAADAALRALAVEVDSLRSNIVAAEQTLQDFVRGNGLAEVVVGSGTSENVPLERLRRLEQELTAAEADGYRAQAAYGSSMAADPAALDSDLLKTLRVRIAEAQSEYARLRSTFTDSFPRTKQVKSELQELNAQLEREQRRIAVSVGSQYETTQRRRELLQAAVQDQRAQLDRLATKTAEYDRLRREVDGHDQLYTVLQQKRKEAAVSAALAMMDVAILDQPLASRNPVRPNPRRDLPLAAVVGLMLGLGLAFLRDYIDRSVRTVDEVDSLGHAPLLALIPSVPPVRGQRRALNGRGGYVQADHRQRDRQDKLTEAFGQLRTSVLFNTAGPIPRSLLITSAQPGEGKTTVSANLAISLAALGRRVLLVDADTRVSAVHRAFRISRDTGLSDFLAGQLEWRDAIRRDVLQNLDIVPAGTVRLNPADLLSGGAVNLMVTEAEAEYDFVILDAPAVLINAADARILAPAVGGTLLVVRSGATTRDLLRRTISQIPNLVGIVLNDLEPRLFPAYYREYGTTASDAQYASGGAGRFTHETGAQAGRSHASAGVAGSGGVES